MANSSPAPRPASDATQLTAYFSACRDRTPPFVDANFSWAGAARRHRFALGRDLVVAPLNVLLALPALLVRLLAAAATRLRWHTVARVLARVPLSFQTRVQRSLLHSLATEVFGLESTRPPFGCSWASPQCAAALERTRFAIAFEHSLLRYAAARTAAAEITVALIAGIMGLVFLDRFSPGSLSAGRAVADAVGHELAIRNFWLGDTLGGWYYGVFSAQTPIMLVVGMVLAVIVVLSVCAAFAGVVADPLQRAVGLHRRRIYRLVGSLEGAALADSSASFDPKDHYAARATDVFDIVRGVWPG